MSLSAATPATSNSSDRASSRGYSLFAAFFECTYGSYQRMAIRGLYEAMISTPLSIEDVITGEVLMGRDPLLI